ncbi:methyltransferase family protein [Micromonospora sp. NPDC007230]|uniref:methyltransferase family protein n=1 Tax=Micromonospora sp. NPDC007230 TaxID=3364237 RepID=UPI0036C40250
MRNRATAAAGTVVFLVLVPGSVAGMIPWALTHWRTRDSVLRIPPLQALGWLLLAAGVGVLVHAFVRFAMEGIGTPAPVAPTTHLVVGGLYRFVRNPMYVAVVAAVVGQAFVLGQTVLLWYGLGVALLQGAFVHLREEPELRRRFGTEYDAYRSNVPAWYPRLRPWRPER